MTPMSAPQSTWCAGSYPCFRARCESGLRVVDAKTRLILWHQSTAQATRTHEEQP
jgi:hypothetical protein